MIDPTQAINYLKQIIEQLETTKNGLDSEFLTLESQKNQLTLDKEALTSRESAFLQKVDGHGAEVERIEQLYALAKKMKQQIDEDNKDLEIETKKLNKREKNIIDLENKEKELSARETLIESRESEVAEKEIFVERDKKNNRLKQEDLEMRAKSIKKKQEQLQKMIDAQKV